MKVAKAFKAIRKAIKDTVTLEEEKKAVKAVKAVKRAAKKQRKLNTVSSLKK